MRATVKHIYPKSMQKYILCEWPKSALVIIHRGSFREYGGDLMKHFPLPSLRERKRFQVLSRYVRVMDNGI